MKKTAHIARNLQRLSSLLLVSFFCLILQASPPAITVRGQLPTGKTALIWFKVGQGIMVQGRNMPRGFLNSETQSVPWIEYRDLNQDGKRWVLLALFPEDLWGEKQVIHIVQYPELETVWLMASFFSGYGQNYPLFLKANPGLPEKVKKGDAWVIPNENLSAELGGQRSGPDRSQPEDTLDDEARIETYRAMLKYQKDTQGTYAAYKIRNGETIYSDVVLRYSDRVFPKEVAELSLLIAKRSGISDVTSIRPGEILKIPIKYLSDPFQSENSNNLAKEREVRTEIKKAKIIKTSPKLEGVLIVLDAGHGGIDRGASANGVWESDFVYDIMCRLHILLQEQTNAKTLVTINYPTVGHQPRNRIRVPSKSAQILTTPRYDNDGDNASSIGVHLRWMKSNTAVAVHQKSGEDHQKTLFISLHADSLHPSAQGSMVYVPGALGVPDRFQIRGFKGVNAKEILSGGTVVFNPRERLLGEVRSRQFAEILIKTLYRNKLPVHKNRAIRNIIQRGANAFVPAVIRYNTAATKVLIEVGNLNNQSDAEDLSDPIFRQQFAQSVFDALQQFFKN